MVKKIEREDICKRLHAEVSKGNSLFIAGIGSGISAKFAEAGGADLLITYPMAKFRMQGLSSVAGYLPICDQNKMVLEMGEREILSVVKDTPVLVGLLGADPTRNMSHLLDKTITVGFSGILNCPTLSLVDGNFGKTLKETGLGYKKEIEMIQNASEKDLFTTAFVTNQEEATAMINVGCDLIIAHMGNTIGGTIGSKTALPLQEAAKRIQKICDVVKKKKPEVFVTAHGGPISTPKDFASILQHTKNVDGYMGGSTAERLPVEISIKDAVAAFKQVK